MLVNSPWLSGFLALSIIVGAVRFVRSIAHSGPRDQTRLFSREQKALILARAGGRCEHSALLFGRCIATQKLEADHIHPHSRGGWTDVSNGQALCRRHNRAKRAAVPFGWQLRSLERRRRDYYPNGVSGLVARRSRRAAEPSSQKPAVH